jgi:hypothetical protein
VWCRDNENEVAAAARDLDISVDDPDDFIIDDLDGW